MSNIKSWSFSALKLFEKCPHAAKLKYLDKLASPDRPDDHPLNRGIAAHTDAEEYVSGLLDKLPTSLRKLSAEFEELRNARAENSAAVVLEEEWAFDVDLENTGWFDPTVWLRIKTDVTWFLDKQNAIVIDYKTGKKDGNEVPHTQQGILYAGGAFIRNPSLEYVEIQFWYLDYGKITKKHYDREKAMKLLRRQIEKGLKMTTATEFPPKPNAMNCKYCDYGTVNGTGECQYAVEPLS